MALLTYYEAQRGTFVMSTQVRDSIYILIVKNLSLFINSIANNQVVMSHLISMLIIRI